MTGTTENIISLTIAGLYLIVLAGGIWLVVRMTHCRRRP